RVALVGLLIALWTRDVRRSRRLPDGVWSDGCILVSLLIVMVSGFLVEGLRIVATQDPWAAWRPVGTATGRLLAAAGLSGFDAQLAAHRFLWWFHMAVSFVFS